VEERHLMEEDVVDDKEKELVEDNLHWLQKVDLMVKINALRMKLENIF